MDADPIYRGIIKEVYTPFSISDNYRLIGASEQVKQKYEDYYEKIHLKDKMMNIFFQYYKYGNVYVYLMEDGSIITLPVHLIRIANIMVNGEPVIELNCRSIKDDLIKNGIKAQKDYLEDDDLDVRLQGFPPEVADALKAGKEYVQLNPENTFVLQDVKEDWARYAIPMVASCLKAFAKKEVISKYETALLNLSARSFVHVKYGNGDHGIDPDRQTLTEVQNIFRQAMTGTALVTTNSYCEANVVQPKIDDMFDHDKYKDVNSDILSAGGISGVIVSGRSEDGSTFASAQVSMQTASMRIKQARDNFCEMMDKINRRLNLSSSSVITHSANSKIPRFTFPPIDLAGNSKFQDTCYKLWQSGVLSSETMLQSHGFDMNQEIERKKSEEASGITEIITKRDDVEMNKESAKTDTSSQTNKIGRPEMDDSERTSDPLKSLTGKQPKPSNPDGSL